jgi:hypothetical protein
MKSSFLAVLLFALGTSLVAQQPEYLPALDGYITRSASSADFDVNGFRAIVEKKAEFARGNLVQSQSILGNPDPYLGAHVLVFGKLDKKKQSIRAQRVLFVPPDSTEVKGSGLIDRLPAPPAGEAEGKLVLADGYVILLSTKTSITFTPPLASLSDVGTNISISYIGEQREDGVVVASAVKLTRNNVPSRQEKAREKADYDPAAVDPNAKQNPAAKAFLGVDPKKTPPYPDPTMQARISKVGESLVPQYQKDLPDSDPTKLHFRFQLVDEPKLRDAMTWPSGVILVPKQVVERMENDSQLAAVLADGVAGLLQNQYYRLQSLQIKAAAAEVAELAIPFGVGAASQVATYKIASDAELRIQRQAARISLCLMKDAGYNLAEAPKAWWILSTKEPKPLVDVKLPERVQYLYEQLGTTWRSQ